MSKLIRTALHRLYLALIAIPFKLMPSLAYMTFSGAGSTQQLCRHIARQGYSRVLIVSDGPLVALGIVQRAIDALEAEPSTVKPYLVSLSSGTIDGEPKDLFVMTAHYAGK